MLKRYLNIGLIGLAVILLPWWSAVALGVVSVVRFRRLYELALPAALFDLLYLAPGRWSLFFVVTAGAIIFVWAADFIRARAFVGFHHVEYL